MNGPFLPATALAFALAVPAAQADILGRISASRIAVISDGDFVAATYRTGKLAPRAAGYRDLLTVLSPSAGKAAASLPVSNSVTSAPEILALSRDGKTAFVTERLGERPESGETIADLPPGRRLFAVDLTNAAAPRLADTAEISAFPEALSPSPDGRRLAVVSNTPEASLIQIVPYRDGRFGRPARFDLAGLDVTGVSTSAPRGGVTATNIHWHPSGRFLAVNINTQNRVAFFEVTGTDDAPVLKAWGNLVEVGADPFVGRFTPDGRHYLTANWGRNFAATNLEGRIPETASTISVVRLADPAASPQSARHDLLGAAATDLSSEGIAVSPDGRLVATVNMRGTAFPPGSARFHRNASVTLLAFDPATGAITRLADYPFEGSLPEGGVFDATGDHFLATVFQGHEGAGPEAGPGLEVFRVVKGERPALEPIGRIPLPHGAHHVDLAP